MSFVTLTALKGEIELKRLDRQKKDCSGREGNIPAGCMV